MKRTWNVIYRWIATRKWHSWIASFSALAQAAAVVAGVYFGLGQLRQAYEGVDRDKKNATYEIVRKLHQAEYKDAMYAIFSNQVKPNGERMSLWEYRQATAPFASILSEALLCVNVGRCDLEVAQDALCPILVLDDLIQKTMLPRTEPFPKEVRLHAICSATFSHLRK